jgi:hypothetical protein
MSVVGIVASLGAVLEFYRAMSPTIVPTYDASVDPYVAPYQIRNDGSWFTMYNVEPECGLADYRMKNGSEIGRLSISVGIQSATILPKRNAIYFCRADLMGVRPGQTTAATIIIHGTYMLHLIPRLWNPRRMFRSDILNLRVDDSGHAHWLEGQIIE